ncbi:adenylate kinase [[Clostridium] dakarense]|uniref:adenylate kinase n=1 Tax=Faecalimicrobium dakarense TaxID=1301100 RepID=UPI0004BAD0E1|nr:adenylate kinase [[Clostridium] dakarense]
MIVLIAGSSHSGKTLLSQKLLDKYKFPYISIDHLKMGLIRSGNTDLTPEDDDKLTDYLWPIVREIVKTAIENKQNLIVEGCYIPFNWKESFDKDYAKQIKYICLIMTKKYIEDNFSDIKNYANTIEKRLDDSSCIKEELIKDNKLNLNMCKKYNCDYVLIDDNYKFEVVL